MTYIKINNKIITSHSETYMTPEEIRNNVKKS